MGHPGNDWGQIQEISRKCLKKKHFYLQTHVWTASQTKQASALCLPTRSNIAVRRTLMGRYLCPLVESYQCLFLFFQTHLYFTILGSYVNWSSCILDIIYGSIYYLCLKIFNWFLHIFSQALEHLHISSECLSDQFDSLVLSLWDWQRKIFSRDLLFALTPTSWVARCLARTRRYAANLRPGQSICYSPPESNLKPGNKRKQ